MKKIALSLATIAAVCMLAVGATSAFLSDTKAITGNTFSSGTVTIGDLSATHLVVTNLLPGTWRSYDVNVPYVGTENADIYAGARGCSAPGDPGYFADSLNMEVYDKVSGDRVFKGTAKEFSSTWVSIATNVSQWTTKQYTLWFQLDPTFSKQGVTNTDTEIVIHAVQKGETDFPTAMPWQTMSKTTCQAWGFSGDGLN